MNDNWLEIIEILTSASQMGDKLSLKTAVKTCLRMLGWKTINNSMIVDYNTPSGAKIDIVLCNKWGGEYRVALPVFINITSDISIENIKSLSLEVGCGWALVVGKALDLYCKSNESEEFVCVEKINYEQDSKIGIELANILHSDNFDQDNLGSFFLNIYKESIPKIRLKALLNSIINDKGKAKEVLKTYLELEGFEGEWVDKEINDINVDVYNTSNMVSESPSQPISNYALNRKKNCHYRTKFSVNGGPLLSKRSFVHAVVCLYVKDHPETTFKDLEIQFPSSIISKERGVVRPYELVKKWAKETGNDILTRYCTKEEEIIRLDDGMEIVVNSQWGITNFPKFLAIAKQLYKVSSSESYPITSVSEYESEISTKRASNFKFSMVGISIGDTVTFDAKGIDVKVVSDNEIEYNGVSYRLSSFVKKFIPNELRTPSDSYRGPDFFSYNGKNLTILRKSSHYNLNENTEHYSRLSDTDTGIHISEQALNSFKNRK